MQPVSRRGFLRTATSLAAGAGYTVPLFAQQNVSPAKSARVNFGFSLYGMRSLKLTVALKTCAQIGYDSVELVATEGWPCDPSRLSAAASKEIRKQLDDLGLQMPSIMENLHVVVDTARRRKNLDRLRRAAELGQTVSPNRPPVIETVLGGRPQQWESVKGKMADGLRDWAKVGQSTKTVIAIKPHVGGALHTPEGAKWLVDQVDSPWIRLTYDYSHLQLRNFELEKSLKTLISRTVFIHIKDKRGTADRFQFLLPGDGDIDYGQYFRLLKVSGYRGSIMVEVSGQIHGKPGYDPVKAAKHSYANLAAVFKKAGLQRG